MLQSIQRRNPHSLVVLEHPQNEVLELEIVARRVASFAEPSTTWTAGVHTEDGVQLSRRGCLVLQTVAVSS